MKANERLARLLFIVPYVVDRDGVPLDELADKLGVSPRQIEQDLDLLLLVGQPPLTPDHLIDLYVEDDVVYVELDQNLSRPLRLTHDEARALVIAAKLVGDLGGLGDELDAIVERILAQLNPVDAEMVRSLGGRIGLGQDEAPAGEPTAHLRQAIDAAQEVAIDYYSVSSDRQKTYRLQPLGLLSHTGIEYLLALDVEANLQEKLFRTDRMAAVEVLPTTFEPPADLDLERFRTQTLYFGANDTSAEVRFAPAVAAVVRERFADQVVVAAPDGSVTVRLSTSSPAWLARWVLPFGTDAEIIGPAEQRESLGRLCREAAEAYRREP